MKEERVLDLEVIEGLEFGRPYTYKELCGVLNEPYYGTCTRSVERQLKSWANYMEFVKENRRIVVQGLTPMAKWAASPLAQIRYGFKDETYNKQLFDILIYNLWKAKRVQKTGVDGKKENWVRISASNYQWKVLMGLVAPQLQGAGKRLYKLAATEILLFKLTTKADVAYYNFLRKIREVGGDALCFGNSNKMAYVNTSVAGETKGASGYVKWSGHFYKVKTVEATKEMVEFVSSAKKDILTDLGFATSTEAFNGGAGEKYSKRVADFMNKLYYDEKQNKFILQNSGVAARYKVINIWDTLVIEAKYKDVVSLMGIIRTEISEEKWKQYFNGLVDAINKRITEGVCCQIDKDDIIPKDKRFDNVAGLTREEIYNQALLIARYNKRVFSEINGKDPREILKQLVSIFGGRENKDGRKAGEVDLTLKGHGSIEQMKNIDVINELFEEGDNNVS